jgi:hypothetical protein
MSDAMRIGVPAKNRQGCQGYETKTGAIPTHRGTLVFEQVVLLARVAFSAVPPSGQRAASRSQWNVMAKRYFAELPISISMLGISTRISAIIFQQCERSRELAVVSLGVEWRK